MITVAIIALIVGLFLGIFWHSPEPTLIAMCIAVIALAFRFAP